MPLGGHRGATALIPFYNCTSVSNCIYCGELHIKMSGFMHMMTVYQNKFPLRVCAAL